MSLLRHAFRQLVLRPGLSAVIIVLLAVGVGQATAISSLFYQALVRPLPVPEPEQLVNVVRTGEDGDVSYPMLRDLEAEQNVFASLAGYDPFQGSLVYRDVGIGVSGAFVSGGYFGTLGLQASLGRLIGPEDEPRIDDSPVIVLGHALWQSRFGADPSIVGQTLTVNGHSLTVIGVAPEEFRGTLAGVRAQVFVPLTMRPRVDSSGASPELAATSRNYYSIALFARLRAEGVEQASAAVNAAYGRIRNELEAPPATATDEQIEQFRQERLELVPGARGQGSIAGVEQSLTLLLGVTLLVLLIVCVSVANLLLARGASRAGEIAVRESLGASRGQLVAQLLTETAVPAVIGGILSLPVAALTVGAVMPILPARFADSLAVGIGAEAAAFAAIASVVTLLAFGLFPALRATRTDAASAMKGQASQTLGGHGATRVQRALITVQIAFSMTLLALAGLFAQSLLNVARIDLGIDVDSLVSVRVALPPRGSDPQRIASLRDRIEQALAAEPGVTSVAAAAIPIMSGPGFTGYPNVEGVELSGERTAVEIVMVNGPFFQTLGIPLLVGRDFLEGDDAAGAPPVAIANERFTRVYGLSGDAIIGKHVSLGPNPSEFVGIVADSAFGSVKGGVPPQIFIPAPPPAASTFYLRTGLEPDALLAAIPRVVAAIDPTLPVSNLTTVRRLVQDNVFVDRLVMILSASFAGLASLLAAVGLYGVTAYNVAARTRELGLRLVLGAAPASLRAMTLKQVGWLAAIGIVIGLAATLAFARAAEALLYGLSAHDPRVLAAAAGLLVVVVLAATYWPARQASRIAPMEALRHE